MKNILIIVIVLVLLSIPSTTAMGTAWTKEMVDPEGEGYDVRNSIVLDSNGNPHISYYADRGLRYARWTGNAWDIQIVDSTQAVGRENNIALDSFGYPHISYRGYPEGLKYARWTGNAWDIQIVDSTGGWESDIFLDSFDNPHIFYDDSPEGLKYARWTGNAWDIRTLDPDAGDIHSIAIAERPSVGWPLPHRIIYANGTGLWAATTEGYRTNVIRGGTIASSVAVDPLLNLHITYIDDYGLKYYAIPISGPMDAWDIQKLYPAAGGGCGPGSLGSTAIAIDSNDNPHLLYTQCDAGQRYYWLRDNEWHSELVDTSMWDTIDLALDRSDYPHIIYINESGGLMYAYRLGTPIQTIVTLQGKFDTVAGPVQTGSMRITIKDRFDRQIKQEIFNNVLDNGVFNIPVVVDLVPDMVYRMVVEMDNAGTFASADVTFGDNSPAGDVIKFKA